ncbi:MAG: amidohydrolase family protein [Acidobacteriota bacterium]
MRILAARWLLPIVSAPVEQGAIAIDGDRIIAVENLAELQLRFPDAVVQDLGEAAILPGLINLHTHLELTVLRGRLEMTAFLPWIIELVTLKRERLTEKNLLVSARLGCLEAIRSGITTVADTANVDAVLPALIESGQRGVVFHECFDAAFNAAAESALRLEKQLDVLDGRLDTGDAGLRDRLSIGISPHAPYTVSADLYRRTVKIAERRGLDLALHASESAAEESLLKDGSGVFAEGLRERGIAWQAPGRSMISYLQELGVLERGPLLIHCVNVDESDLALMARNGARMAHCPKSNAKLGHGIAPLGEALRLGIRVGLGTDSVASNNNCNLIEESRFALLLHRAQGNTAIDASQMLRMMTLDSARALGLESLIGSLEVGKKADLIAIDLSNAHNTPNYDPASAIIFSCSGRDCIMTMVAGRVLYEGGQVETIDEEATLLEAGAIAVKLRG